MSRCPRLGYCSRATAAARVSPLLLQSALLLAVSIETALRMLALGPRANDTETVVALVMVLGVTAVAAVEHTRPFLGLWVAVLPTIDLVAIAISRVSPQAGAVGLLVALPALWLGLVLGRPGVMVSLVVTLLGFTAPALVVDFSGYVEVSRSVQVPLMALTCASVMALAVEAWLRQEDALLEARRTNEAMIEGIDVGVAILDRSGSYVTANSRHHEMSLVAFDGGIAPGQTGSALHAFAEDGVTPLSAEDLPSVRALRDGDFAGVIVWIGREPATRRALSVSARATRDERGDVESVVLAYYDVTSQLRAMRMKDEFVAAVSHELRTPLTSIIGYVDVLLEDIEDLPPVARRQLAVVQRNSGRLMGLVDDLLLTAAHQNGVTLDASAVDVFDVATRAVEAGRHQAAASDLTLRLEGGPVPVVQADPGRLGQVVDNLISNAVKYTPPGGTVVVRVDVEADEVVLAVADNGLGIGAHDLGEVFERFYRAEDVTRRAIQGVGLGLAISKSIVDGHDGTIEVTSELGEGSTFTVRLPRPTPLGCTLARQPTSSPVPRPTNQRAG